MKKIRLFFKRLYWSYVLRRSNKTKLVEMLKNPDKDVADLLLRAYLGQVRDVHELMTIVYDDRRKFHRATRLAAGKTVLMVLKEELGFLLLSGISENEWTNTERGRLAYLIGVALYLPELRRKANFIVEHYFYSHERAAFAGT